MKSLWPGLAPDEEMVLVEGFRRMSPSQKIRLAGQWTEVLKKFVLAEIRRRHPQANDHELKLRLASRWIAPDLMREAFGWDAQSEGY